MKQSKLFSKTIKTVDAHSISHQFLLRAGFINQLMAGAYSFLPLGLLVLKKIENIIRENMLAISGQEILMPALTPKENWQKTGRWDSFDALFKIEEYALAATHEEIVAPLARSVISSYKDLPLYIFQIQTKFRNEKRAKSGILRTREFLMKDLYSFSATEKELNDYYEIVKKRYIKIFNDCGLAFNKKTFLTLASGGSFSEYSHEFQTVTEAGEDIIYICRKCQNAVNREIKKDKCPICSSNDFLEQKSVEVGNIFKLGNKYSLPFGLKYIDAQGKENPVIMGCYGIGLNRLMGAVAEVSHDDKGIIWPEKIAPFSVHLISLGKNKEAEKIYKSLLKLKIDVLYDDRDKSPGEKFAEADLIGIPYRLVVSEKTLSVKSVEVKKRSESKIKLVKIDKINEKTF
ncbi:prolyl-tRNA synthetase [Patescibacteria group bacterium]|nr:prolyl-tRNA synthetase [Patescibacteria group bacterium]